MVLRSKKVTKVDGSVDENSGLKYTVGDKFQGLLSRTIDRALGGMQESSEDAVQNNHPANSVQSSSTEASNVTHVDPTHSPPEWGSTWPSQTASAKSRTNEEKAIPDKTTTAKAETENVVAESVSAQHVSAEKAVDPQRRRWLSRSAHNTTTVQQDAPRDVGPSAIGRKAQACRILG